MKTRTLFVLVAILLAAGPVGATIITLQPVADATLSSSGAAADQPENLPTLAQVGTNGAVKRPLLKFDLSSVPDDATLTSARLILSQTGVDGGDGYFTAIAHMTNDNWLEESITWNSYGETGAVLVAILPFDTAPTRMWNLSLTAWDYASDLADDAVTFMVRWYVDIHGGTEADAIYKSVVYSSKEGAAAPTLELEFSGGSPPQPSLLIAKTNQAVIVSWPVVAADWLLEHTNRLSGGSVPWPVVPPPYQINGDIISVTFTNPSTGGSQFFRLHKP